MHHQSEGTEIQDANHIGKKIKQRQQHEFRYSDNPLPVKYEKNQIKPDPYSRDKQSGTVRRAVTTGKQLLRSQAEPSGREKLFQDIQKHACQKQQKANKQLFAIIKIPFSFLLTRSYRIPSVFSTVSRQSGIK